MILKWGGEMGMFHPMFGEYLIVNTNTKKEGTVPHVIGGSEKHCQKMTKEVVKLLMTRFIK